MKVKTWRELSSGAVAPNASAIAEQLRSSEIFRHTTSLGKREDENTGQLVETVADMDTGVESSHIVSILVITYCYGMDTGVESLHIVSDAIPTTRPCCFCFSAAASDSD